MVFRCFVEIGWVVYVSFGPGAGKLVMIVMSLIRTGLWLMGLALR
jgi:hypothetical protein